jgi:hypothetical protein
MRKFITLFAIASFISFSAFAQEAAETDNEVSKEVADTSSSESSDIETVSE